MIQMRPILAFVLIALFGGCAGPLPEGSARVAVFGDSMMAWNGISDQSAPDVLSELIGEPVANFAVSAARMSHPRGISGAAGFDVRKQYRPGDWSVIIVNGGANDVFFECACHSCEGLVDAMISTDGQNGTLPFHLFQMRSTGADVIYVGYHRSRGLNGPAKGCRDELDAIDARVAKLAEREKGISFVSLQTVFPIGDPAYYALDRVHPSPKGSAAIAARMAPVVRDLLN